MLKVNREYIFQTLGAILLGVSFYFLATAINSYLEINAPSIYIMFFSLEDSPSEVITVVCSAVCFLIYLKSYLKERKKEDLLLFLWFLLTTFEELSIKSNILSTNLQDELNLHNLPLFHMSNVLPFFYYLVPFLILIYKNSNHFIKTVATTTFFSCSLSYFNLDLFTPYNAVINSEQFEFLMAITLLILSSNKKIIILITGSFIIYTSYFYSATMKNNYVHRFSILLSHAEDLAYRNKNILNYYHYAQAIDQKEKSLLDIELIHSLAIYKNYLQPSSLEYKKGIKRLNKYHDSHLIFEWLKYSYFDSLNDEKMKAYYHLKIKSWEARTCIEQYIVNIFTTHNQNCRYDKKANYYNYIFKVFKDNNEFFYLQKRKNIKNYRQLAYLSRLYRAEAEIFRKEYKLFPSKKQGDF